jgi:hypothetical protein
MIPVPQMLMIAGKVAPSVIGAVGSFAQAACKRKRWKKLSLKQLRQLLKLEQN